MFCSDNDVGLLSGSQGSYTIAALVATSAPEVYDLHRFNSSIGIWLHEKVLVVEQQIRLPVKIPRRSSRLLDHNTSTVVSIGGEYGTMGWIDLWGWILKVIGCSSLRGGGGELCTLKT